MTVAKGFLHWVQIVDAAKTLYGDNFPILRLNRQNRAGLHGPTIKMNRAGTTLRGIAAHMGTCQSQMFTQDAD
jgi:hypothetical protein